MFPLRISPCMDAHYLMERMVIKSVNVNNGIVKLYWSKDDSVTPEEQAILYDYSYFNNTE